MRTQYIGTSGYSYAYWKGRFYPQGVPASKWLAYYATQLNTVELNNTFYRFPIAKNLKKAADTVPDNFLFSVKAHKIITHTRRMKDVGEKVKEFMDIVLTGMGEKLGCVLYQLPPSYTYSEERLEDVVAAVDASVTNVIEFRHSSWWRAEVYDAFKTNNITFCSVSYPGLPEDNVSTATTFYKRMHGVPELFASAYDEAQLQQLVKDVPKSKRCFIYFNNTMYEAGYTNALLLQQLMS